MAVIARTNLGRRLVERIGKEICETEASLGDGSAHDYGAYRHSVGFIQGMKEALVLLDELEGEP